MHCRVVSDKPEELYNLPEERLLLVVSSSYRLVQVNDVTDVGDGVLSLADVKSVSEKHQHLWPDNGVDTGKGGRPLITRERSHHRI